MVSPTVTPYSGLEDVAKYVLNILYTCIYSIMMGGYFHLFSVVDIVNGLIAFLARKGPLSTKVLRMTIKLLLEKKTYTTSQVIALPAEIRRHRQHLLRKY